MNIAIHNKLGFRLSVFTALFVILCAIAISLWLLSTEKKEVIASNLQQLEFAGSQFSDSHIRRIDDITNTAIALNKSIAARLASQDKVPPSLFHPDEIKRREDGALRINNGISGAFLAKSSPVTKKIERLLFFTKRSFEVVQPLAGVHFFNFYFISPENFIRISPPKWAMTIDADHEFSNDPFYRIGTPSENPQREARWTQIYYDSIWQHWMTSIVVPLYRDDEFLGVTGCDIILDDFFDRILAFSTSNSGMKAFLIDSEGNIIVHPDIQLPIHQSGDSMNAPYPTQKGTDQIDKKISEHAITHKVSTDTIQSLTMKNKRYYYSYYLIPSQQWFLCISISEDTMMRNFDRVIASVVIFSIAMSLFLFLTLRYLVSKLILKRLKTLETTIEQFSSGDLSAEVTITGNDEISALQTGVQAMQTAIREQIEELLLAQQNLKISEAKYRNYIDNAPDGIFITDDEGQILEVNNQASEITGYTKEELLSKTIIDLLAPDTINEGTSHFRRVRDNGFGSITIAFITKNGERRYWTVNAVKLSDSRMLGFVNDVTTIQKNEVELQRYRSQLEILVRERTAELEEKNQELEKFNRLFVGREFRIKELRTKIHDLVQRLSRYEEIDGQ